MQVDANKSSHLPRKSFLWILLLLLVLLKIYWSGPPTNAALVKMRPLVEPHSGFAGSDSCRECHEDNHRTWFASWHRTMTQEASMENILGNFNVTNLTFADTTNKFTLFERDGRAWFRPGYRLDHVATNETARQEYPIVMMTGSHHQQLYWYPIGEARTLAILPLAHIKEANRWIPRESKSLRPPLHEYQSEAGRWNTICLNCHSTGPLPNDHSSTNSPFNIDTQVAELGISCEACHGPGQNHVTIHRNPGSAAAKTLSDPIVNPASLDHRLSSQICGSCHSARYVSRKIRNRPYHDPGQEFTNNYRLGHSPREKMEPILKAYPEKFPRPEDLNPMYDGHFWWDGMVRMSGREYSGLAQSACHTKGELSCLTCHAMHQAASDKRPIKEWANDQLHPDHQGNKVCVECHDTQTYATATHTHHLPDSSGSQCYNCHMPYTTYGLLKTIRSHTISSPTVIETLEAGRPNACNLCHLDKTLDWSGTHLANWYGQEKPSLDESQNTVSSALLMALEGNAAERALIACAMAWPPAVETSHGTNWIPPVLSRLLQDPYDAVRFVAGKSLSSYPGFTSLDYDFLAAKPLRTNAAVNAFNTWTQFKREQNARPEVLLRQDGSLDQTRFEKIYARRNNRDVYVFE